MFIGCFQLLFLNIYYLLTNDHYTFFAVFESSCLRRPLDWRRPKGLSYLSACFPDYNADKAITIRLAFIFSVQLHYFLPIHLISLFLQIFKYLNSLEVEDAKDVKSGYSITFVCFFIQLIFLICCYCLLILIWEDYWVLLLFNLLNWGYQSQHFTSNPFFEDAKLTKTFTFLEEGTTKITATPIKWKEGKVNINR